MKKITLLSLIFASSFMVAQNTVTVDGSAEFLGFANVFETPANGGAFVFGSPWAVEDIKSVIDVGANTVTLFPNFNTYGDNPTDPFWVDQGTGEGNKVFEGNTFNENNTNLVGEELTFEAEVQSFTLDPDYEVKAFIKVFNADFSVLKEESVVLTETGNFSITYTNVEPEDATVQYGFAVTGINANPDDEPTLGNVVVGPFNLSTSDFDVNSIVVYPNPTTQNWILNNKNASNFSVNLYDVNGKLLSVYENITTQNFSIDASSLKSGIYFASIITENKSNTIKLIKR
ncbi:MAG: T9SS type A sorting domain-containing protein [Flavobacteriaceae bacterium]